MRIRLVTFSDGSHALRAAGRRLVREADSTGWFDHPSEHWTLETLRTKVPDFYFKHHKFMRDHRKGFGYWIWKPAILSYLLDHLEDDEIVLGTPDANQSKNKNELKKAFLKMQKNKNVNRILLNRFVQKIA